MLIANGMTNKEAARALDISPRTVETQRANLMAKLQIRGVAQLVRYVTFVGVMERHCDGRG